MFGYVQYDLPNLFVKDVMLYRAVYCGLCKGIAASCGELARVGLSYDVAFLSALLHNMKGVDFVIERQHCLEHAVKRRPIAKVDALTEELGALNTALCYYKLTDDVEDGGRGRGKRLFFAKGLKRAKKKYPETVEILERFMKEQAAVEGLRPASPDAAAEPTAEMMRALSEHLLADMGTPDALGLFYDLGKWIYLIDALDDYEQDAKRKNYNPFLCAYGEGTRRELLEKNGEEIGFLFDTLFYSMREHLGHIKFYFNRDLTDNVILRGIPLETKRVMEGRPRNRTNLKL